MGSTQCDLCLGRRFGEAPGRHSKAHATQAPLCSLEGRRAWAGGRLEPQGGSSAAARAARLTIRRFLGRERLALFGAHDQIHCHCEPILVKLAVLRLDQALTWAGRTSTQVEVGGRQVGGRQGRVQPSVWQVASCASIPPTLHHPPTHPRIHRSIDICLPSICLPVYLSIARLAHIDQAPDRVQCRRRQSGAPGWPQAVESAPPGRQECRIRHQPRSASTRQGRSSRAVRAATSNAAGPLERWAAAFMWVASSLSLLSVAGALEHRSHLAAADLAASGPHL